ncbi:MAG: DUF2334 domain-containing protein [Acidimicrobiales bacterium]
MRRGRADTDVFFRDDDLGALSPEARHVITLMAERDVPVNYQLVPKLVTPTSAAGLVSVRRDAAGLVRLNQHGWTHETVIKGRPTPAELAGHPSRDEQRRRIVAGREHLSSLLGEAHDRRVFTPPNHAYDRTTLKLLAECGFDIISAGYRVDPVARAVYRLGRLAGRVELGGRAVSRHGTVGPTGLRELSVSVNVDMNGRGERVTRTGAELVTLFDRARAVTETVGVMLHHECWVSGERDAKTAALIDLVDHIRSAPGCRLATIEDIADRLAGSPAAAPG